MSEADQVVVRVPATTRHVALVRATASSLAAMVDFSYDRITDLHIAVDEVCSRILATSHPRATRLEVRFTVEKDGILVEATGNAALREGAEFLNPWSRAILEAVAEGVTVAADGLAGISFRVSGG